VCKLVQWHLGCRRRKTIICRFSYLSKLTFLAAAANAVTLPPCETWRPKVEVYEKLSSITDYVTEQTCTYGGASYLYSVSGSNVCRDTYYPDWVIPWVSSVTQDKCQAILRNGPLSLPSTLFQLRLHWLSSRSKLYNLTSSNKTFKIE
jgi:hypothetical protein